MALSEKKVPPEITFSPLTATMPKTDKAARPTTGVAPTCIEAAKRMAVENKATSLQEIE
jgi:hypothetical protein